MQRRLTGLAVGLAALAIGCGSAGNDAAAPRAESVPAPQPASVAQASTPQAEGSQSVRYGNVELTVPAGWPVHDLAAAPNTCVRFDVNAVYLGTPSADMQCPAAAIGRADAVLVEPGPRSSSEPAAPADGEVTVASVNGLSLEVDGSGVVEHEIVVTVPDAGVTVTLSYGATDEVAQQIVQSVRVAQ